MYRALWNALPGPKWARAAILGAGGVIVVVLLMMFVFPLIDNMLSA
jgi:hypothetical protein